MAAKSGPKQWGRARRERIRIFTMHPPVVVDEFAVDKDRRPLGEIGLAEISLSLTLMGLSVLLTK